MTSKKVNWIFLSIILCHFLISFWIAIAIVRGMSFGMVESIFWGEMAVVLPGLLYYLMRDRKQSVREELGFRKIRISTVFLTVLYTILLMPLVTVVNAFSMLFVDNTVLSVSVDIMQEPFWLMFFMMAVFGPVCEELMFRGIIFRGYRRDGSLIGAAVLSAIVFGFMHMNFNQAGYAFVLGIGFSLLMAATGSIWPPIIAHFYVNGQSVCMMYLQEYLTPGSLAEEAAASTSRQEMLIMIGVFAMIAAVTTTLAACLLVWMAKREGHEGELRSLWKKPEDRKRRITIPLVIALVISFLYMLLEAVAVAMM